MKLQRFACSALALSLSLSATAAHAVVTIRNATGSDATDFHIVFSGPADQLKLVSSNFGVGTTYPPPSPKQNEIDFAGGKVKNGQSHNINNLVLVGGLGGLRITDWWFTGPAKLPGEPLVKMPDGSYTDLPTLTGLKYSFQAVPEPASWALMILGFGFVGGMVRRQAVSAARRDA